MVSENTRGAIVALLGFVLGVTVATSIEELNGFSGVQLVGPIYFSPQLGLIGGFAVMCFFIILYATGFLTTTDE